MSNIDNIEESKVARSTIETKQKSILKSEVTLQSSKKIPRDKMRNDQKKEFKKKIEKDIKRYNQYSIAQQ